MRWKTEALNRLKNDMSQHKVGILLFQIPASPRNMVMCCKNVAYARNSESLKPLDQAKQDEIRNQSPNPDGSGEIVQNATIDDLDDLALAKARVMYKKVHDKIPREEVEGWTTEEFLSNSEVLVDGKLRAALLLLGSALPTIHEKTTCSQYFTKSSFGTLLYCKINCSLLHASSSCLLTGTGPHSAPKRFST